MSYKSCSASSWSDSTQNHQKESEIEKSQNLEFWFQCTAAVLGTHQVWILIVFVLIVFILFSETWNIPLRFWSILTRQRSGSGCWFWSQHILKVLLDRDPETGGLVNSSPQPNVSTSTSGSLAVCKKTKTTNTGILFSFCCFHTFLNAIFFKMLSLAFSLQLTQVCWEFICIFL